MTISGSVSLRFQHQLAYVISKATERSYRYQIQIGRYRYKLQSSGHRSQHVDGLWFVRGMCGDVSNRTFSLKTQSTKLAEKQDRWLISPSNPNLERRTSRVAIFQLQGNLGSELLENHPQQQRDRENTAGSAGLWHHHPNLKGIKHICMEGERVSREDPEGR